MAHVQTIEAYFREHPPATIPEAISLREAASLPRQRVKT